MNFIGMQIKHKAFGVGVVRMQEKGILTIDFPAKTSQFEYNETNFTKFLTAVDPEDQTAILEELKTMQEMEKQKSLEAVLAKQKEKEAKQEVLAAKYAVSGKTTPKKAAVKQERIPGKRMTFYVFQGSTFDRESKGGYIWAPISGKDGGMPHHWTYG